MFLWETNKGACKETGRAFGELIQNFFVGDNKIFIMASDGATKIFGSIERKKHEKNLDD